MQVTLWLLVGVVEVIMVLVVVLVVYLQTQLLLTLPLHTQSPLGQAVLVEFQQRARQVQILFFPQ
jgi:hypothetical protein